ncbi:exodeoxyribonuclease VII large subunit [Buchananella felis]|uniref:exodeoxyribonuclease VII large subunit n=1 Tax=Buchananella felis TaxID=3231492 RepID=UPI003529A755
MSITPRPLPERAAQTTADNPWPLRLLNAKIEEYVAKMAPVWVEGQIVQLNRRPGAGMAFLTLRDLDQDSSITVSIYARDLSPSLADGARVVVNAKATFWPKRGSLQLHASEIRAVGLGDLLARIEQLRQMLAAEGLFDPRRKRPLPFLPRKVGLICGRESKAEHDVVVNATARWPGLALEIREVAVQGERCVPEVSAALAELDADQSVDVIIIARGGGSVEDLLPFSNEHLVRAVAAARTPVVSAIGHETDCPLLDLVADVRASTPTDAARRVVPSLSELTVELDALTSSLHAAFSARLTREREGLLELTSRPVLASPAQLVERQREGLDSALARLRGAANRAVLEARADLSALSASLHALSPAATMERGYALLALSNGTLVRSQADVPAGTLVEGFLADGRFVAKIVGSTPTSPAPKGLE